MVIQGIEVLQAIQMVQEVPKVAHKLSAGIPQCEVLRTFSFTSSVYGPDVLDCKFE